MVRLFVWLSCCLAMLVSLDGRADNTLTDIRASFDGGSARVVVESTQVPEYSYFTLNKPQRLVIDFRNSQSRLALKSLVLDERLVKRIRYSAPKQKTSVRLVLEIVEGLDISVFPMPEEKGAASRLVIDLVDPKAPQRPVVVVAEPSANRDIVVAIDAGHGGMDPGSVGPSGTFEKDITLSIAQYLKTLIDAEPGLSSVMTRSGDYYIRPERRPWIAREQKADLLVSIHADAFTSPEPRGGSVWILSKKRADNELGRWIENSERHSELLGGAAEVITDKASERYLAETIINMTMDANIVMSDSLSQVVIKEMRKVTRMHKSKRQTASLAVLTAPDIPSILVEVGFISNPQEEKNLNWSEYRQRLAQAMFKAIRDYMRQDPPDGTLWAKQKRQVRRHEVRAGESLSLLAKRYQVSVESIKQLNKLSSDNVRIGQVLTIPTVDPAS